MTDFAEILKRAVEHVGTQALLAAEIGKTQQLISEKIRNGKPLTAEDAIRLEQRTGYPKENIRPDLWQDRAEAGEEAVS